MHHERCSCGLRIWQDDHLCVNALQAMCTPTSGACACTTTGPMSAGRCTLSLETAATGRCAALPLVAKQHGRTSTLCLCLTNFLKHCAGVTLSSRPDRQHMTLLCLAQGLSRDYLDQPRWSAMREASYGHATLDFESATAATFRWHRNQVQMEHLPLSEAHHSFYAACLVPPDAGVSDVQPCVIADNISLSA